MKMNRFYRNAIVPALIASAAALVLCSCDNSAVSSSQNNMSKAFDVPPTVTEAEITTEEITATTVFSTEKPSETSAQTTADATEKHSEDTPEIPEDTETPSKENEKEKRTNLLDKIADKRKKRRTPREKGDFSCFDNSVFMGNSRTLDLLDYGLIKNAYAAIGVDVKTVYTKCSPGSSVPIMQKVGKRHFDMYFLQFGENECGWSSEKAFTNAYGKIIDDIKRKDPTAEIYVQSIIPITAAASRKAEFDCTNERINHFNKLLAQLADDKNVNFVDVAAGLKNSSGALPDEAAPDGTHLTPKYCKVWLDYLADNI